jgi:hypothetical protein
MWLCLIWTSSSPIAANPDTVPFYLVFLRQLGAAPASLAVELSASPVHNEAEIEAAITAFAREPRGGLIKVRLGRFERHTTGNANGVRRAVSIIQCAIIQGVDFQIDGQTIYDKQLDFWIWEFQPDEELWKDDPGKNWCI